jgi:hypothetical protein
MYKTAATIGALLLAAAPLTFAQTGPPAGSTRSSTAEPAGAGRSGSYSSALTPADVKMMIEGAGYSQVTDVQRTVGGYSATAVKHGKWWTLELDPAGQLIDQR